MHEAAGRCADCSGAAKLAGAGFGCLIGGLAVGALPRFDGALRILPVVAGLFGFIALVRRALLLCGADSLVFARPSRRAPPPTIEPPARSVRRTAPRRSANRKASRAGLAALGLLAAAQLRGQQTVFNVPTADALDRGKLYIETDWLWRPVDPRLASGEVRGVYGLGRELEAGVNLAGLDPAGRSSVVVVPNLKWRTYHSEAVFVTAGTMLLFHAGGQEARRAALLTYAHAAARLPVGSRLTAGAWLAMPDYASPTRQAGGLFAIEQPLGSRITLAGDWYTGKSGLGYLSLGLIAAAGRWILYAAYSFKNGDSRGNGLLLELGVTP